MSGTATRRRSPALLRALRPEQWLKNGFVLAPLVFAGRTGDPEAWANGLLAVLAFSAAASATYLLNDVRDREADRRHPVKRARPVASGELSVTGALLGAVAAVAVAVLLAALIGGRFPQLLAAYLALTVLYSLLLKEAVWIDVLTVAAGFVLRVVGGAAAVRVPVSSWLLLCAFLLALYLVLGKRRSELALLGDGASGHRSVLRQYSLPLVDQAIAVVLAATLVAYALYTVAPDTVARVGSEGLLATVPIVLYGLLRYLYLLHTSPAGGSPTRTLLADRPLLACVAVWLLVAALIVGWR